jgi:uncharacterized repeat protein (TIGR04002 family)
MKHNALKHIVLTGLMAALTCALTFVHLPMPMLNSGYVHLGDALVYLASCLLPLPYAAAAAALGGGLADVLSGAAIWAPATVVIKACMALCFSAKREKTLCGRNAAALLPASLINGAGYLLYEGLMFGSWTAILLPSLTGSLLQSGGSALLFLGLTAVMDQIGLKKIWRV